MITLIITRVIRAYRLSGISRDCDNCNDASLPSQMTYRNFMLTNSRHIASLRVSCIHYPKIKRRISKSEKFVELIASIVNLIYGQE